MSQKDILLSNLILRKEELEEAVKKAKSQIEPSVSGNIEVNRNRNHYRYYYKAGDEEKNISGKGNQGYQEHNNKQDGRESEAGKKLYFRPKRKYLSDLKFVSIIVRNNYAKIMLQKGMRELKQIDALIKTYNTIAVDDIYKNLHPGRQVLIEPIMLDDDKYAEEWLANAEIQRLSNLEKKQNTYPNQFPILTENQEVVRSKSEKIIADKLKLMRIPYVYEQPLHLGNTTKYPDFTVLNKITRRVFYWEHMGLLDQEDYCENALSKLAVYSKNGIWPGKNLIVTYETKHYPLDVKQIERIIEEYLM